MRSYYLKHERQTINRRTKDAIIFGVLMRLDGWSLELGIAIASVGIAGDNVQGAQAQDEVADHQEVGLVLVGANLLETGAELLTTLDAVLLHHLEGELGGVVTRLPHVPRGPHVATGEARAQDELLAALVILEALGAGLLLGHEVTVPGFPVRIANSARIGTGHVVGTGATLAKGRFQVCGIVRLGLGIVPLDGATDRAGQFDVAAEAGLENFTRQHFFQSVRQSKS